MQGFKTIVPALLGVVAMMPAIGMAARPPSGGDTVPPGKVQNATFEAAARAITLKFVAPGDDGSSGTAAGYDVFYQPGVCPENPNPVNWTRAPRSIETKAVPAGSTDFFNVRSASDGDGLEAGTPYCIAIRARDEKPNFGSFIYLDTMTSGVSGDWPLAPRLALTPKSLRASDSHFAFPLAGGDAVLGWINYDLATNTSTSMSFAGPNWMRIVAADPIGRLDSFRLAAIPDGTGRVGAVFGGRLAGSGKSAYVFHYMLVEVGPDGSPQVEIVASGKAETGGVDYGPDGDVTYVESSGAWNPVITVERIVSKTNAIKRTRLDIGERVSGAWQWVPVLEREGANQNDGFFDDVELFTKTDGTLGFVAPHCGVVVYAERRPGGWAYWDVGPSSTSSTSRATSVAFSETGAPVLARRSRYDGVIQINHPDLSEAPFAPPVSCANVATSHPTLGKMSPVSHILT